MIPLSSRIEKFRKIIEKKEQSGKTCDILHIVKLDDSRESVFLIQDIFLFRFIGRQPGNEMKQK